jgi:hypothetical protein
MLVGVGTRSANTLGVGLFDRGIESKANRLESLCGGTELLRNPASAWARLRRLGSRWNGCWKAGGLFLAGKRLA